MGSDEGKTIRLFTIHTGISDHLLAWILRTGKECYECVSDPAMADYFLFPTNYEVGHELSDFYLNYFQGVPQDRELALKYEGEIISLARRYNKKIIIFFFSDDSSAIPVLNAIVFRTSIRNSKERRNEYAMPAFKNDLSGISQEPEFLDWEPIPSVAFRGQAASSLSIRQERKNRVNLMANRFGFDNLFRIAGNHGYLQRMNAIRYLQRDKNLKTDFTLTTEKNIDDAASMKMFRENIFQHPYNLCASGFGNYSYRFYEVISAGRIPVFLNTDCRLPFEDVINWKEMLVWIEEKEISKIGDKILSFHRRFSEEGFRAHQEKLKNIWRDWLRPESYFRQIKRYL